MGFLTSVKEKTIKRVDSTKENTAKGFKAWVTAKHKTETKRQTKKEKKKATSSRRSLGTDMFSSRIFFKEKNPKNDLMNVKGGIF